MAGTAVTVPHQNAVSFSASAINMPVTVGRSSELKHKVARLPLVTLPI